MSRALAASVMLFSIDAAAATIQVGPTRTLTEINQAVASLNPGDVVEVDGGAQYAPLLLTRSGSAAQPIRIVGLRAGGARPQIMGGVEHVRGPGRPLRRRGLRHLGRDVALLLPPRRRRHDARQRRARLPRPRHPRRRPGLGLASCSSTSRCTTTGAGDAAPSDLHGHRRGRAPGLGVPDAALLRPRRQRRQQRQVARRAQRDLLQLDRGRALPRARAHRPRPDGAAAGWTRTRARGLGRRRQRAPQDGDVVRDPYRRRRHRAGRRGATGSSTTPSSRRPAAARCSASSTGSRASRCTTTSSS